ncbi:hypothetical protein BH11MYX4_BH11MYX4_26320 [soil metagenome]
MAQPAPPEIPHEPAADRTSGPQRVAHAASVGGGGLRRLWLALPGPKTRIDLLRRTLGPVLLALVPLFWVIDATSRASTVIVTRDQGIFQYIAWAVRNGDVDYRDIRDVNGPFVHMIHGILLRFGGGDEHRFHVLELWATGLSFAFVGACIPGLVSRHAPRWLERATWAAAGWVVLSAQYMLYTTWNQAQRESLLDWFLLPSLAIQLLPPAKTSRAAALRVVAIGALSTITCFGKPSFAIFPVMQLVVLLLDRDLVIGARAKVTNLVFGGLIGAAFPVLYLLVYGDVRAWARLTFVDVPQVYRFIWAKSVQEIYGEDGPLASAALGLAASALLVGLVAMRQLPRRALVIALAPLCGLVNVTLQHKGFGYHFHPLTASTHIAFLVVVAMLWERFRTTPRRLPLGRLAALVVTIALALNMASGMRNSTHIVRNAWLLSGGETAEKRTKEEYFQTFKSYDFFPWELNQAAAYLREKTSPTARVQMYGMDPYLLFLAQRKSATPYIYAYDLNNDAALDGGWSNKPTEGDLYRIRRARDQHEQDLLARLRAAPPEAFVFLDKSPLISYQDAWEDFRHCCSESARWVAATYHPARSFGDVHVWLRDDSPVLDDDAPIPGLLRSPPAQR